MEPWPLELEWARVIGRAFLPKGLLGGVVDDVDFGERFADECRRSRWDGAFALRASLWMAWLAPLWMWKSLRTLRRVDADKRVAVLEQLLKSRRYLVRMAALLLKLTACSLLLGDERALKQIGAYDYPRPQSLRVLK